MFLKKKKRIKYLRDIWGKSIDKFRNFDLIGSYHSLLKSKSNEEYVDDKTWSDLELDSLFTKIDRNISCIGQQYLYHQLHKYEPDENLLKKRFDLITTLKNNQSLRENIQLNLFGLSGHSSNFIAYLVLNEELPKTKFYPLFYICSLLSALSVVMIAYNGVFLFVALAILLINLIINKIFSGKIYEYFTGFSSLNSLIVTAIAISKLKNDFRIEEINLLKQNRTLLKSLKKKLGYLVVDKESLNELAVVVIEYLNMFLLFDVIAYYRSVNILLKNQKEIRKVYESVARLDSSISIASYLSEIPFYSNPVFSKSNTLKMDSIYHPTIENAIPNSIEEISGSALITGSNMAGKTTFIKTVGINVVLSQTLYFSLSKKFFIPKLKVKTSIRRNDNMAKGKSYFFVEIELLNNFVKLSNEENNYLFLIDEIFRGTNTIERLATSTAVLKYLGTNNKVLCTTHDIELQDLLENTFSMFHFSEQVENGKFFFNYKIKEGPCSSGNAIKLLGIMDYPDSIISESNRIVKTLLQNERLVDLTKE